MGYVRPSVQDFKDFFVRDFPYTNSIDTGVTDNDIAKAMQEANFNINEDLFSDQPQFTLGFLYITAHYLVTDLRNASSGIYGSYEWMVNSKSAGSVSESFSIPEQFMNDPYLMMIGKTNYGAKYLSLILPQLRGNAFSVCGYTHP